MKTSRLLSKAMIILSTFGLLSLQSITAAQSTGNITVSGSVVSPQTFSCQLNQQDMKNFNRNQLTRCQYTNSVQYSHQVVHFMQNDGQSVTKDVVTLT